MHAPKIALSDGFETSRIALGCWRLHEWILGTQELQSFIEKVLDMGITTFDHADIYGNYICETLFGKALSRRSSLRKNMQIVTKCGIKLITDKYPERKIKHYDYSYNYIIESVENSLRNLQTDRIELLLLHRPSPLLNPHEVAKAFSALKESGKVLHFGVSNFSPLEFETLQAHVDQQLVTNQVEISPLCLEHFENGNMNFFLKNNITPMAWSPLAGGNFFKPTQDRELAVNRVLGQIGEEIGATTVAQVALCWLLKHPSNIIPILGSGKTERIKESIKALHMDMTTEQWFGIYATSLGRQIP